MKKVQTKERATNDTFFFFVRVWFCEKKIFSLYGNKRELTNENR